jgi:hypothetical protein
MLPIVNEASPPAEVIAGSAEVGEDNLYGSFSPRASPSPLPQPHVSFACEGEDTIGVKAPVMLLMPELQELCGKLTPPLSVMHLEVDSLAASTMASTKPSVEPSLDDACESVDTIGVKPPVMLFMPELQQLCGKSAPPLSVVHLEVDSLAASTMACATPSVEPSQLLLSDALFAKEIFDLLVSLEAASPGSAKEIACLLSEKPTGNKVKKVMEYLRRKSKKNGATRKASTAA